MKKLSFSMMTVLAMAGMALAGCTGQKWSEQQVDSFMLVTQKGGPSLGYSPQSGVKLLTVDGFAFKDLNRNDRSMPMRTGGSLPRSALPTSPHSSPSRRLQD